MSTITTRSSATSTGATAKGSSLSIAEMDANLNALNADKLESNTFAAVDGEVVVFNGTTGKSVRRNTALSGLMKAASGILSNAVAGTDYAAPNQVMYIGTTALNINRGSGALTLADVNITGSAGTAGTAGSAGSASTAGTATNSDNIYSIPQSANSTYHLTFVNSNSSSAYRNLSVSSTAKPLTYNPSNGDLTAAGNMTANSDNRYKKNWQPLMPNISAKLAKVRSGTYQLRNDKTNRRMVGVSAQSLGKILPEAIVADHKGKLSVAYGQAAMSLCVELAKEIVELRRDIEKLKKGNK